MPPYLVVARDKTQKRDPNLGLQRQTFGPIKGGHICLYDGELDPSAKLVIAEGIETVLAVAQIGGNLPAIAGISANNLREINPPPAAEYLIAADNDAPGLKGARALKVKVFLRVGPAPDGGVYLDLCNNDWQVVWIGTTGWSLAKPHGIRFIRRRGMLPLPVPVEGGTVEELRTFINVKNDSDFVLVVAWLLAALSNHGPYPVLLAWGEPGSAKSSLLKMLRGFVDPAVAPLRAPPREDRDLFIAATNAWVVTFDNISWLPAWLSDTLARLATGGGFGTRQLYSDDEERLFDATRPILLGGIENVVIRGDLADRALIIQLGEIPDEERQLERHLWPAFEAAAPRLLGALLTAVSAGLEALPSVDLKQLPRMADFAEWASPARAACGNQERS